jgi:signal transduction histidine kinase
MTARIALVDLADGTVLAVRAALGAGAVRVCKRGAVPAGTALVIVEAGDAPVRDDLGLADPATPVLVLAEPRSRPAIELAGRLFDVLEKSFTAAELRSKARALLEGGTGDGSRFRDDRDPSRISGAGVSRWLGEPLLEAGVARTLAGSLRAGGAVWLVGQPGTGTDDVAAALAGSWEAARLPAIWQDDETLTATLPRLDDQSRVLWVPSLDEKPPGEQRALERFLALEPSRRIVVTSGDDPESAVAAGTLAASLVAKLSRASVRLAPLRERRRDLLAIALAIAADVASRFAPGLRVSFTDRARHALETYDWPHNLVELESVLTRSLLARSGDDTPTTLELDADDLLLAPLHLSPLFRDYASDEADVAATGPAGTAPRRAVVVTLGDVAAARASAAAGAERALAQLAGDPAATASSAAAPDDAGIEGVLLGFAHDIRNPMSTIKTFAGLEAAREGSETAELARLAAQACERVDEQLELLQRYSEIGEASPASVDLVEILGEAAEAAGAEDDLVIAARRAVTGRLDPALARLVADAIVAECRARRAPESGDEPSTADIGATTVPGTATLDITIPTGRAAVDRLDKWVAGKTLPWRLALARDAARRAGGTLVVEVEDGQIRLAWRLPVTGALVSATTGALAGATTGALAGATQGALRSATGEPNSSPVTVVDEGKHDDQAGSPDRRRRSRSS